MEQNLGVQILWLTIGIKIKERDWERFSWKLNAIIIPPFDHVDVINGQGTAGYEILKECSIKNIDPDLILCCCGGGGLIAGTAIKEKIPRVPIYAVEPENFNDTKLSLDKGEITELILTKNLFVMLY